MEGYLSDILSCHKNSFSVLGLCDVFAAATAAATAAAATAAVVVADDDDDDEDDFLP